MLTNEEHDRLMKNAEDMTPLANELMEFAFHRLMEDHKPANGGAVFAALLQAWLNMACRACPGCARNLLWAGRNAITDRRETLAREHMH
jgi:hypothetical protein